ncbi:uncharacterized protein B4U80_11279 [Leptotrombidium deliense]|uniref:PNT domain-containing protein n=1 Tax=Leptotrombidium deliense TaxID=299467 RepID=A0A443SN55_9ACAR|nr:uncharacterized protein B4U80_11279 [Leptotrombidium deliense]
MFWDFDDINKWLQWVQKDFGIASINNVHLFPTTGPELCQFTFDDFFRIVGCRETCKVLYNNLNHLKRARGHKVDEEIVDLCMSDESSGKVIVLFLPYLSAPVFLSH